MTDARRALAGGVGGDPTPRLEAVLNEVAVAARLVASGGATRVTIGGLPFGEHLLKAAQKIAAEHGGGVEPLWWPDDEGCDLLVHRLGDHV